MAVGSDCIGYATAVLPQIQMSRAERAALRRTFCARTQILRLLTATGLATFEGRRTRCVITKTDDA
jgi:hypothetical protein